MLVIEIPLVGEVFGTRGTALDAGAALDADARHLRHVVGLDGSHGAFGGAQAAAAALGHVRHRLDLQNIDEVISVIRNSYDDAKERLMERFGMSEIQAQSVLDMRLGQLQKLNGEKIETEFNSFFILQISINCIFIQV